MRVIWKGGIRAGRKWIYWVGLGNEGSFERGTVASGNSVTRRVLAKMFINSQIYIPTYKDLICG